MSAINLNKALAEMRALQAQAQMKKPEPAAKSQSDFGQMFANAINGVNEVQQTSSKLQQAFELGDPNVDLVQVMIASQKSQVAFTALTQVRNKMLNAYQEIMNMQV